MGLDFAGVVRNYAFATAHANPRRMSDIRQRILEALVAVAETRATPLVAKLSDETILLESGLDSLGFAILVAQLEEELGYDPFVQMDTPVYPKTLGEFVAIYERFKPASR